MKITVACTCIYMYSVHVHVHLIVLTDTECRRCQISPILAPALHQALQLDTSQCLALYFSADITYMYIHTTEYARVWGNVITNTKPLGLLHLSSVYYRRKVLINTLKIVLYITSFIAEPKGKVCINTTKGVGATFSFNKKTCHNTCFNCIV